MKIKSLQFYDYRAFYAETDSDKENYFVKIDGKNLLMYGENGSGKTSFFRGLKDLIHREDFTSHYKTPILNDGYLEVTFDDDSTDRFDASGTKASKLELLNTSKLNSFLSYKELLKTHLSEDSEINYFELLVSEILKEHNLETLGPLNGAWAKLKGRDINSEIATIQASVPAELTEEEAKEQIEILEVEYEVAFTKFKDEFDKLLASINAGIAETLRYFNQGVTLTFALEELTKESLESPELFCTVEYGDFGKKGHHKFLNEARLSALAISVYLTALKTNPTESAIKLLFLDDIFLGLDLNNRLPLLDILKEKFNDWQVFLTTYDRHWFEVAKQHLNTNWLAIEMYATAVVEKSFEKPLIIQSENYFEKAKKYLAAGDYPASLNYLRKELESQVKKRLSEESTRHFDEKPHALSYLWDLMVERYSINGQGALITEEIKQELKTFRLSLLNPLSHDNLSAPIYKYELLRGISLMEKIQAIPVTKGVTLLAKGMELIFKHPKVSYTLTLELTQDWRIDIVGSTKKHHYPTCLLKYWEYNKSPYYNTFANKEGRKPNELPKEKLNHVAAKLAEQKILQPLTEIEFNKSTSLEGIWSIHELLERCANEKRDSWFMRIFRK